MTKLTVELLTRRVLIEKHCIVFRTIIVYRCSVFTYWYKDNVNEIFNVRNFLDAQDMMDTFGLHVKHDDYEARNMYLVMPDNDRIIYKQDCTIIKTKYNNG